MTGPLLVFVFAASQAARDIFLPHIFARFGFFDVVLIVFLAATLIGWTVLLCLERGQIALVREHWRMLFVISLATAAAWISYFFALGRIEPAIANTLFSGSGPFVVITAAVLGAGGVVPRSTWERLCYLGLLGALAAIVGVAVTGQSGLAVGDAWRTGAGCLGAVAAGALIAFSLLMSRRLNEVGVSANAVMAARFVVGAAAAGVVIAALEQTSTIAANPDTLIVVVAAIGLIVLPSYALQIGVARTAPLTVQVIVPLSPIMVFAAQALDPRTLFAPATLICIVLYAVFVLGANLLRGWRDDPAK
jgi:drug/metabolite transporter (DMT)-like permease